MDYISIAHNGGQRLLTTMYPNLYLQSHSPGSLTLKRIASFFCPMNTIKNIQIHSSHEILINYLLSNAVEHTKMGIAHVMHKVV